MKERTTSEYAGRIHALREIEKVKMQMVFARVDSARHDIGDFLDGDKQKVDLLDQAKEQLDTLYGFLQEFK